MTNRTQSGRLVLCAGALAILAATVCGCKNEPKVKAEHQEPGVWFVHATDPHIFIPDATESTSEAAKAAALKQQELNEKAFSDMLKRRPSVPECYEPPASL